MCGICGVFDYGRGGGVDEKLIVKMRDTMVHRGPDDAGIYLSKDSRLGLGHRRLSIIDLSPAGHQPMCNEDGSLWVVFNGEIYNYRSLVQELAAKGHVFRSQSDTEAIVHLYEEYGKECVSRLDGMYAIALWDERTGTLTLVRDRLGVKPLYYYHRNGVFLFASEIKAILAHPAVSRDVDEEALYHYLTFVTTPSPLTLFKNIGKLAPGTMMTVDVSGSADVKEYWNPLTASLQGGRRDETAYMEEIRRLLKESVKKRMISDVPFGVFLSGGMDSSLNVALMSRLMDRPVETFTVGFRGEGAEKYNELDYARRIAKEFKTNHHEIIIEERDLAEYIPTLVYHQDEPIADPVCVPLYYVSKLARDSGVIVVQIGEGSDELFCGYDSYMLAVGLNRRWWPLYLRVPLWLRRMAQGIGTRLYRMTGHERMGAELLRRAARGEELFWGGAVAFTELDKGFLLSPEYRERLGPLSSHGIISRIYERVDREAPGADFLQRLIYLDLKLRLPELLLMRVDKMTMSTSVEGREPFLDYRLVELAMGIPMDIRIKNQAKYILKRSAEGLIPREIIYRKKMGFGIPIYEWFRRGLREYFEISLFDSAIKKRGYFDYGYVNWIFDINQRGKKDYSFQLWNLFNLSQWYDRWIEGSA